MNKNFTDSQFAEIKNTFGSVFNVTFNKAGNIKIMLPNAHDFWVLYFTSNKRYMWRRHNPNAIYTSCCYPLNMNSRNDLNIDCDGKYKYYDASRHAEFATVNEAITYFKKYLKKYRSITID